MAGPIACSYCILSATAKLGKIAYIPTALCLADEQVFYENFVVEKILAASHPREFPLQAKRFV